MLFVSGKYSRYQLESGAVVIRETIHSGEVHVRHLRSLFLSDIHLGTRGCQAELLLDFLKHHEAQRIYLVGDIIDGWRLRKKRFWPASHQDVMNQILERGRRGVELIYIPGNHDEFLRRHNRTRFGCVRFADSIEHLTAGGRRYLIIHGDQFDVVMQNAKWLAFLGDRFYVTALALNTWLNIFRRRLGLNYWSLGAFAKQHVKQFVNLIGKFEDTISAEIDKRDLDGIICGHIHHASDREVNGIHYLNTGDWVESCTAIGENLDGSLEVIRWQGAEQIDPRPIKDTETIVAA
ncbi:UDP-2,3-diacylglucosamine hydrolase [Labrenzia sp. THAF82]|uniref:UDP-2,3-diacylglucosamine diphosphatase n=1 Tax=Labrenzia sp. THAF82 TaxID=2587861 RepID=UPI0012681434|nr:UDP-2,3-diacylglucosamine diphosphatase [Labrenzia sp. THAF82]QFT31895.1 UDP-2,3-diacylglucosamine hydrolase [Labrenzia sp. THAF82]